MATRLASSPISIEFNELLFQHGVEIAIDEAGRIDAAGDGADGVGGLFHRGLDTDDLTTDFIGRTRGLLRKLLHLACDHRKAAPGFTRARRLDGGIQREQEVWPAID